MSYSKDFTQTLEPTYKPSTPEETVLFNRQQILAFNIINLKTGANLKATQLLRKYKDPKNKAPWMNAQKAFENMKEVFMVGQTADLS